MAGKELDDMTECSICTEVFTDPRVLPCIHTFCLKCLLNYGKDSYPGDRIPCPLCREEFTVPAEGISGIKRNFEKEKLLHFRKLLAGQEAQHISSHTQVDNGSGSKSAEMLKMSVNMCDQHKGKEIEMFCRDCKVALCLKCVITSHKTHDCLDIEKVSEDLRKMVLSDNHKTSEAWKKTEELRQRLEKEKNDVIKHLAGIEDEINTAADKLIAAIQRDKVKLLSDVASIKMKRLKQLEMVKQELVQHTTALESFKRYSETLLSSGTACDVTRSANSLHDTADELMKFDVIGHVDSSLPPVNVTFTSSTLLDRDDRNLVGTVTEEGQSEQISSSDEVDNGQGRPLYRSMDGACVQKNTQGGTKIMHIFIKVGERKIWGERMIMPKLLKYMFAYLFPLTFSKIFSFDSISSPFRNAT